MLLTSLSYSKSLLICSAHHQNKQDSVPGKPPQDRHLHRAVTSTADSWGFPCALPTVFFTDFTKMCLWTLLHKKNNSGKKFPERFWLFEISLGSLWKDQFLSPLSHCTSPLCFGDITALVHQQRHRCRSCGLGLPAVLPCVCSHSSLLTTDGGAFTLFIIRLSP